MSNSNEKTVKLTLEIVTYFRESTREWVGEIEYDYPTRENGTVRVTGQTEQQAYSKAVRKLASFKSTGFAN